MGENEFIGLLVGALAVLVGLVAAIITPIIKLNSNIVKLNEGLAYMKENDAVRDKRIENHGKEIDDIIEKQKMNEKILDRHELRIGSLEEKLRK